MTLSEIVRFAQAQEAAENMKRNKEMFAPTLSPADSKVEAREVEPDHEY